MKYSLLKNLIANSIVVYFLSFSQNAFSCSSCGSSATSPLILYPNENLKMYVGLSESYNFMNYGIRGGSKTARWINPDITTKETLTYALGVRTTEYSFVTLTGSFIRNEGLKDIKNSYSGNESYYLIGDPIITGRYDLMRMNINNEWHPQIQFIGSFKPKVAKNMVDGDGSALETTGNGFYQATGGIDFWWGMPFIQFGGSQLITYSFDRSPNLDLPNNNRVTKKTRGIQYTTVLTIGHTFVEKKVALQGGIILDYTDKEKTYLQNNTTGQTTAVETDSMQSNSVFMTMNWNLTDLDMVRFSYTYGGAFDGDLGPFTNSRQTTSNSMLVAYERTFF